MCSEVLISWAFLVLVLADKSPKKAGYVVILVEFLLARLQLLLALVVKKGSVKIFRDCCISITSRVSIAVCQHFWYDRLLSETKELIFHGQKMKYRYRARCFCRTQIFLILSALLNFCDLAFLMVTSAATHTQTSH